MREVYIKQFELLSDRVREHSNRWRSLVGEASKRIRSLKIEAGCDTVPLDLNVFAKFVGISKIIEVPLSMNARLLREGAHIIAEVNRELPEFQKRQAIAHEISHLVLEKKYLTLISSRSERKHIPEALPHRLIEKLCNETSSEILLPLYWLREQLGYSTPSLELIKKIATISQTTIDFVAMQVQNKGLWKCRFLWWNLTNGKLFVTNSCPVEPEDILLSIKAKDIHSSLIAKSIREQKFLSGREELLIDDHEEIREKNNEYNIQCIPLSTNSALSMLLYQ